MKIYLFCESTGIYQGEDFADGFPKTGATVELPAGATTIAPPNYARGEVPVFLASEERWIVRQIVRLSDWQGTNGPDDVADPAVAAE